MEVTIVRRRSHDRVGREGPEQPVRLVPRLGVLERRIGAPGDPSPHVERDLASGVGLAMDEGPDEDVQHGAAAPC